MAASYSSIDHDLKGIPNQFQEIYALVQKRLDEKRKVLLILDIDGVQDEARLEVEKAIAKYLEKQSGAFKEYINKIVVPSVISLCTELAREEFYESGNPFKWLIDYILLPEKDEKDHEKIFSSLEQSSKANDHQYYLSYCELLKVLRKTELPASYDTVMDGITKSITSNTALICAMHLSTAICATSPLVVAYQNKDATADLATLYHDFQGGGKSDSAVFQLTARTEAMAYTFSESLRNMLAENKAEVKSLADQGLQYNYNKEEFPLHPTSAITGSNIIAASRNDKDLVIREFLAQNSLLLDDSIHIIFVDDSTSAHTDMNRLPTRPGVKCTLEQVLFNRSRTPEEKQALSASVAESLQQIGLEVAITEYRKTCKDVDDSAASAVINYYVPDLLRGDIIDHDKIVQALNSNSQPQQSTSPSRTWSTANPITHFSPEKKIKIERKIYGSQQLTIIEQQPTVTDAPQLH